jgi:hypothetical protein
LLSDGVIPGTLALARGIYATKGKLMMKCRYIFVIVIYFMTLATPSIAHDNVVSMKVNGDLRCITSNASPKHDIGQFPNRGNPHSFKAQKIKVCVDATPQKSGKITWRTRGAGISITGILFRPGTADWYDASSRRGFSKNNSSGWNLEGMGPDNLLGMDKENAHVDKNGLYHYHSVSPSLAAGLKDSLIGYAADGFEIHYIKDKVTSSWRLKSGKRSTPPFGIYDGTYNQDYEYVADNGILDECNGSMLNGRYVYFATDTYPFFPRCFVGKVSRYFKGRP